MKELIKISIPEAYDNLMIKEILYDHLDFSRKSLSKIKNNHGIFLNGQDVYVTVKVKTGDVLQLFIPEESSEEILPQPIPIHIVYEDEDIVVIDKQAHIVVHPTRSHYLGTIANGLIYYWQSRGEKYRFRPVNRLDKDTSGLFIVAKNQYAHHKLALQIRENQLTRTYHAIVHGIIIKDNGAIEAPILKDPHHATKRIVVNDVDAKTATTFYHVLKRSKQFSLVQLQLGTGRTHQIRVHMSYINHPLVGDELYGGKATYVMKRQALHAFELNFYHPVTGKMLKFKALYPKDMNEFISTL